MQTPAMTDRSQPLELAVYTAQSVAAYPLPQTGQVRIGRAADNDIRIQDPTVSSHHAVLHIGSTLRIEDVGSANGIKVLSHRAGAGTAQIVETRLPPMASMEIGLGDGVTVGTTLLTIRHDEGESKPVSSRGARSFVSPVIRDSKMRKLYEVADKVAQAPINVLLLGETGVGKEVMAEAIHRRSPKARGPFVALNCAALSESLLESELFGHEAGAFTGAQRTKAGLLESADDGTVFLDEVGELPFSIQVKLLRVLEERKVLRVGGLTRRAINVRFISATNRNLEVEVARGNFRQDLYFRLNGISLVIHPLRERIAEIEPLARMFVARACAQMKLRLAPEISAEALAALEKHSWPGNIRELRNVMERAVVLCSGNTIMPEHLGISTPVSAPPAPWHGQTISLAGAPSIAPSSAVDSRGANSSPITHIPSTLPAAPVPTPLRSEMEELERRRILDALDKCGGNQTHAAEMLGMSRRTLVARLSAYGLTKPRRKPSDTA